MKGQYRYFTISMQQMKPFCQTFSKTAPTTLKKPLHQKSRSRIRFWRSRSPVKQARSLNCAFACARAHDEAQSDHALLHVPLKCGSHLSAHTSRCDTDDWVPHLGTWASLQFQSSSCLVLFICIFRFQTEISSLFIFLKCCPNKVFFPTSLERCSLPNAFNFDTFKFFFLQLATTHQSYFPHVLT